MPEYRTIPIRESETTDGVPLSKYADRVVDHMTLKGWENSDRTKTVEDGETVVRLKFSRG